MNESRMLKPALIGGIALGVLSSLPLINLFNCFCCAWVIAGGVIAARLYVKDSPAPVSLGGGVVIGLLTGAIGTLISALFSIPLHLMTGRGGLSAMEQMKEAMDRLPNVPAETREMIESLASRGDINSALLIFGFIFMLVLYCIFGMVGGTIGVAIFEKRKPGSAPPQFPSYQPPPDIPPPPPPPPE
ncbi:MAG: hypothetical protein JXA73_09905 [Acidobacteria bacterium]|nr:hypothetical protein [Acidobacteriota bacterium]